MYLGPDGSWELAEFEHKQNAQEATVLSDMNFFKLRDEKNLKILCSLVILAENGGDQRFMITR